MLGSVQKEQDSVVQKAAGRIKSHALCPGLKAIQEKMWENLFKTSCRLPFKVLYSWERCGSEWGWLEGGGEKRYAHTHICCLCVCVTDGALSILLLYLWEDI